MDKDKLDTMTYEELRAAMRRAKYRVDWWEKAVAMHGDNAEYSRLAEEAEKTYDAISAAVYTYYDVKAPEYEIKLTLKDVDVLDLLQLLADSCDAETRRKVGDTEQLFREIEKQTLGQPAGIGGVEMVLKESDVGVLCSLALGMSEYDDKFGDMLVLAGKIRDQRNAQMQGRGFEWKF